MMLDYGAAQSQGERSLPAFLQARSTYSGSMQMTDQTAGKNRREIV
jgi:hypothetical protein